MWCYTFYACIKDRLLLKMKIVNSKTFSGYYLFKIQVFRPFVPIVELGLAVWRAIFGRCLTADRCFCVYSSPSPVLFTSVANWPNFRPHNSKGTEFLFC
jgi:hypothetical protein